MPPPMRPQPSTMYGSMEPMMHTAPLRGRALVINSSISLLQTFLFFHHRNPAVLICWTMGQQAFNACMILILDAWETENDLNEWLVNQAFVVFAELEKKGVHKLAELAVQRISDGLMQLGHRRDERERQASSAYRAPSLTLDTASLTDWSGDTVMGDTGMFLLEDPGYQAFVQHSFQPLGWNRAGSTYASNPPTPNIPSSIVPASQVSAAPFPVMVPTYLPTAMPVTSSPFAIGLQPRMPQPQRRPTARHSHSHPGPQAAFTPINTGHMAPQQQQQQSFSHHRGPRHSHPSQQGGSSAHTGAGVGPRSSHKLDRPPRSLKRRQ